jgi:hypothetical protein
MSTHLFFGLLRAVTTCGKLQEKFALSIKLG